MSKIAQKAAGRRGEQRPRLAAVEKRQHRDIHYYEYLEGLHYFSSLADQTFFGLFQPAIERHVLVG